LRDLVSYDHKHNEANLENGRDGSDDNRSHNHGVEGETDDSAILTLRRRQMRNMLATLLVSTGTPMLVAGDEFGRTQRGNNNAYCQDNEISWLNWDHEQWQLDLLATTSELIHLRRRHPALRRRSFFSGKPVSTGSAPDLAWLDREGTPFTDGHWQSHETRAFAMYIDGHCGIDPTTGEAIEDSAFLLMVNGHPDDKDFVLPGPPFAAAWEWLHITDDQERANTSHPAKPGATVTLTGRSLGLLRAVDSP
jgi:isoamylase